MLTQNWKINNFKKAMDVEKYIKKSLKLAQKAAEREEVPVGAVIVDSYGEILSSAHNEVEKRQDITAHAEMLALKKAMKKRTEKKLPDCAIFISLEPCPMCLQAILMAGIRKIYYAASDEKGGAVESLKNFEHLRSLAKFSKGINAQESADLLRKFFKRLR
jgi:tRNA(adenine34) deaminase